MVKILADPVQSGGSSGQFPFDEGNAGGGGTWQGGGSGMDYIPLDISFESPQHGYVETKTEKRITRATQAQ